MSKKICGLKLPEEINDYIRAKAGKEGRSLANVVALMVINYYNINYTEKESN